ncbi:hypothetical protein EDC96DRAFT_20125 [Choanephora cucurbitarum]|nr:hypothetical protein EDC96DRAFT_20125 [Choanephora cucurbitarum]
MQDTNIDPIAFFDHLAATSPSSKNGSSFFSKSDDSQANYSIETVKQQSPPIQHAQSIHFQQVWNDLVDEYTAEQQALSRHLKSQLNALEEVDDHFRKANIDLHHKIENTYYELSSDIHHHKQQLEVEKTQFEAEKKLIKEIHQFREEKLNVGGQLFETSLSTLRKDPNSMLANMFGENSKIMPDADNSYFIDRDSTYFRLVLNYLRDLQIPTGIINDHKVMDELMQEARFYKLYDLLRLKWSHIPRMTQDELHRLYPPPKPISSQDHTAYRPIVIQLEKKNLANLDFSGYHIDPRSSFSESNLENCHFEHAKFGFDFDHQVDFSYSFLLGACLPLEGTENRASGVQFNLEGAILDNLK